MKTFEYASLHQYLDVVLKNNPNASDLEIKNAKATYWKLYSATYQKKRRAKIQEFTLGFDDKTMFVLNEKRMELSLSEFLYQCVFQALELNTFIDNKVLSEIHQNQMEIINLLEALLENDTNIITNTLLDVMENLETKIIDLTL